LDETRANIPSVMPHTEWVFVEAIDTLRFAEPWDIGDSNHTLDWLKRSGFYLFRGEIIAPAASVAHRIELPEC
jgi:hypothetical protein